MNSTDTNEIKAIKKAAEKMTEQVNIIDLPVGGQAKLIPVSASLLSEVMASIPEPKVPTFFNEDKGRDEENPFDPAYKQALEEADQKRGKVMMDTMMMFGVELLDGVPEDRRWLRQLMQLERNGQLDLSAYDLEDEFDLEFVYKKYIAVPASIVEKVTSISGISTREVAEAEKSFPSD